MKETGEANQVVGYRFQGYTLDLTTHSLYSPEGDLCTLSSRALDTLKILIAHRGQALSKDFLLETVWPDTFVQENNLNQVISSLRKVLGDSKRSSQTIKTLIGKGYCFVADIEEIRSSDLDSRAEEPVDAIQENTHGLPVPGRAGWQSRKPAGVYGSLLVLVLALVAVLGAAYWWQSSPSPSVSALAASQDTPTFQGNFQDDSANADTDIIAGSIAVLPFTNLTPDPGRTQKIFSLGLHDELINQLSQVTNLTIISPETVISPYIREMSLQDIGRKLRVASVITGSVLFIDDQARIKLQLLEPETGVVNWAYDYTIGTGSLKDMIYANRDMATRVSQILQADIGQVVVPAYPVSPTDSFEAYRYNLAARRAYYNQNFEKSWTLSKKALALDPDFHGALYNFSRAHYYLASRPLENMTTHDHLKMGLESAQRLIELAPEKHEGYVMKTMALAAMGHWREAMKEIRHLDEMDAPAWELQPLAPVLMSLGRYQATIDILETSLQTSPLDSYSRGFLMAAYEATGNSMQASLEYQTGEELTPDWWGDVVNFFLMLGRGKIIDDLENQEGTSDEVKALLAGIYSGDRAGTLASLQEAYEVEAPSTSRNVHYAAIAALMDEHELAIRFMMRSTENLLLHLHWIWQPVFRETWEHPEFINLLQSSGIMDYWQEYGSPEICQTADLDYFVCAM